MFRFAVSIVPAAAVLAAAAKSQIDFGTPAFWMLAVAVGGVAELARHFVFEKLPAEGRSPGLLAHVIALQTLIALGVFQLFLMASR